MRDSVDHDNSKETLPAIVRVFIETVLAGQLVLAAFYWWLTPKGFPLLHPRFWLNSAIPIATVLAIVVALIAMLRHRVRVPAACLVASAFAWGGVAIAGRLLFPVSLAGKWLLGLLPFACASAGVLASLRTARLPVSVWLASALVGGVTGLFAAWAQVPPALATRPFAESISIQPGGDQSLPARPLVDVTQRSIFHPEAAELSVACGSVSIRVAPLLTFDRVSADGFWSIFAPPHLDTRRVTDFSVEEESFRCTYDDGSSIRVTQLDEAGNLQLEATTHVDGDTYSHLNSFCVLTVTGHQSLAVAFSPCERAHIDVLPADYPTGRPARFAYVDGDNAFHVAEAASGEKGPFKQLATGHLGRGDPLTISFWDSEELVASVDLQDWSSQLSTTLSPTAGWAVPVNAIEFQRLGESEDSVVQIWITLAGTSVGRGWECVGHRGGVYRNRITIRGN